MPTEMENPLHKLTPEQIEAIGKEFDALHEEVFEDLGDRDARYIRSMIELHRRLALLGRVLLVGSRYKPLWAAGTATLSLAKILENMEIGHNVMHGQWDWMNDPVINSAAWDWDSASTPEAWKHSHNYVHHTYTNIRGKDKDLGYEIMRIDPHQKWHPGLPRRSRSTTSSWRRCSSGASPSTTSTSTRSARARSPRRRCAASSRAWRPRRARRSSRTTSRSRCSARC